MERMGRVAEFGDDGQSGVDGGSWVVCGGDGDQVVEDLGVECFVGVRREEGVDEGVGWC